MSIWAENAVFTESIDKAVNVDFIPWEDLKGKTLFITGATGLIGTALIKSLSLANQKYDLDIRILALVRSIEKARERFEVEEKTGILQLLVGSVEELPHIEEHIDYVIHAASQTSSKAFVDYAVETIQTAVVGTKNMLELARINKVLGFVYLSSMEVYGTPQKGHKVSENDPGVLNPLDVRNSYPISKLMCESLCCAYASEYMIPTRVARLTQTFGPGVDQNDNRIFAYLAKCVVNKQDIVLKTKGETERSYLSVTDSVTAILAILLKGESGSAYNCANENTYCSIAEMAEKVAMDGGVKVRYEIQDAKANGFLNTIFMDLDTTKLQKIGWRPIYGTDIGEMFRNLIKWFE